MSGLYGQLIKYRDSDCYPFHMPGHKRNLKAVAGESSGLLADIAQIDLTEIEGFDNLHQAEGVLQEAQQDAAALYGADETFFLINGSTCGILAAIAASAEKGNRILMARNCHRSVYHAVYLQELSATYLYPDVIEEYGIADGIDPEQVERELKRQKTRGEKETAAVVITSPTYEGIVSDIVKIADITHKYGKILIVDEAHGAHFGFHKAFPENAVRQGADLVIHSLHKTLPAMTQTALLHVTGDRVDRERLRRYLGIFQTSSPSYVLMASIDSCMNTVKKTGENGWENVLGLRCRLEERLSGCRHFKLAGPPFSGSHMKAMEPGKLVIAVRDGVMTGRELYDTLREQFHIQMEMAAESYVLGILTAADTEEGIDRLSRALKEIDTDMEAKEEKVRDAAGREAAKAPDGTGRGKIFAALPVRMTVARACSLPCEKRPLRECRGRTAAEFIGLYPPGIPFAVPGEELTEELLKRIETCISMKLNVQGVENKQIKTVKAEGE